MEPEGSFPCLQLPANCPYPEPIQSMPPHLTSWRSILILSSLLSTPGSSEWFLPPGFSTKTLYSSLLHPIVLHAQPISFFFIWWGEQIIKLLVVRSSPLPCYLVPLRPKYSPQNPTLELPQPTFLSQCDWPSLTPLQNKMHNYSSVHLNLYIFA